MKTTVIHVNDMQEGDVYIGRAVPWRGLVASKWANTFKIGVHGDRAEVIAKYRIAIEGCIEVFPEIYNLSELRGKRLACWCHPEPCHGDVLAELADAQ